MIGDEPGNTRKHPEASAGALPQGEGWSRATVSSRDTSLTWPSAVCLAVKPVGEPDAGNRHVRFDERGGETGPRQARLRRPPRKRRPLPPEAYRHRAPPRLYFPCLGWTSAYDPGCVKTISWRPRRNIES